MNIKNIINKFFTKKSELNNFSIPNEFILTNKDLSNYRFYLTAKSDLSPKELEREEEKIDADVNRYMKTDKAQILKSPLNNFTINAISVGNVPYSYGDMDISLGLTNVNNSFFGLRHPSTKLLEIFLTNKENPSTILYGFLRAGAQNWVDFNNFEYKSNRTFSFYSKPTTFHPEQYKNNKEIIFINQNFQYNNIANPSDSSLYLSSNIFRKNTHPFKGIVVQNFKFENDIPSSLQKMDKQFENILSEDSNNMQEFERLAFDLYNKTNGKISFISQMNDIILIKGIDQTENVIFTTLSQQDLSPKLNNIPRIQTCQEINHQDVQNCKSDINNDLDI